MVKRSLNMCRVCLGTGGGGAQRRAPPKGNEFVAIFCLSTVVLFHFVPQFSQESFCSGFGLEHEASVQRFLG